MQINIAYDSNVSAAPAGFVAGINYAVDFFESVFTNDITVNIKVGFGSVDGHYVDPSAIAVTYPTVPGVISYDEIAGFTESNPSNVASLPSYDPTNGGYYYASSAELKAYGLDYSSYYPNDADIIFNASFVNSYDPNQRQIAGEYDAIGVMEHELSHALGRIDHVEPSNLLSPLDLFRYTAPGVLATYTTTSPTYFSLDNGQTSLYYFQTYSGSDAGLEVDSWGNEPQDIFNVLGFPGVESYLSSTDIELMEALGYNVANVNIGDGNNLVGSGEQDVYLRSSSGQILNYQYDKTGALVGGFAFKLAGSPLDVDGRLTVVGGGGDFYQDDGYTVIFRDERAVVQVWEFDARGNAIAAQALIYAGTNLTIDASTSIVGDAGDYFSLNDRTLYVRGGDGSLYAWGIDGSGTLNAATTFLNGAGVNLTFGAGVSIVGSGEDFFRINGSTLFVRNTDTTVSAFEFDGSSRLIQSATLMNGPNPLSFTSGQTIVGGGEDYFQTGGESIYIRNEDGSLFVYEYDASGNGQAAAPLQGGVGFSIIDTSTTVVGGGEDFLDNGEAATFLRGGDGTLRFMGNENLGTVNTEINFTNQGTAFVIDRDTTIIGVGQDLYGIGGKAILARGADSLLNGWEFDGSGVLIGAHTLTANGVALSVSTSTRVLGSVGDFFGTGGQAIFLTDSSGINHIWEFNSAGERTGAI